jgi:hypothetical protein
MNQAASLGPSTWMCDPGLHANRCSWNMLNDLRAITDIHNPSVIYANVSWTDDEEHSEGNDRLIEYLDEQENMFGRTVILADTRNNSRWLQQKKHDCRGDLAFRCKEETILCELQEWAKLKDSGVPKCVEDLDDEHFADCLSGIAESHHLLDK